LLYFKTKQKENSKGKPEFETIKKEQK